MEAKAEFSVLFFTLLILFCLWPLSAYGLLSPQGVNFEVVALMKIKNSLVDPHGVFDNWDETAVDPCSWNMVTCSTDGFVVSLGTPSQNLSGTLSPSIGNLTNLQSLLLQENNITGSVPSELGKLLKLKTLDISSNFFTGSIPKELSDLRILQYLRLNNNSLVGEIPPSLANMSQLVVLDMSYNNLTGPIPSLRAQTINLVGNSLSCPTKPSKNCTITTPMPVSFALNNSQSTYQSDSSKRHNIALALGTTITCICLLVFAFGVFLWWRQKHNKQIFFDVNEKNFEEICFGTLKRFHFRELQNATSNFSSKNLIGKGGSGNVYKGCLQDGTVVAVKRLRDSDATGGDFQFLTEVEMIGLAAHRNILRLRGFCMTSTERILVYPYLTNGSVASRLRAKPTLSWSARKTIARGAARGLRYLHEQCDPKIIHRDVKAANILLDEELNPVVGDFGLAKLLDHNDTHVSTAVRGTAGHIAPEYLSTGRSSERTDVFGFGILLLELISGQRVLEFGKAANPRGAMLDWVRKIQQDKEIEQLADKELNGTYDRVEFEEMVRVAILCTQYLPNHRPNMSEVVEMLEGDRLVEKWEASNDNRLITTSNSRCRSSGTDDFSSLERYSDLTDDSSLLVEAMELSGPR